MKMKSTILILALFVSVSVMSQERAKSIYAHISDKSVTLTPFYKIFGSNFDPSFTIGGEHDLYRRGILRLFHNLEATWYSHALTGKGLSLSSSIGIRSKFPFALFLDASIGVIGSVFVSGRETFMLNDQGQYEAKTPLHWIAGVPVDLGLGYEFDEYSVYIRYRYQVEGKYTDILPMIPSSTFGVGMKYRITPKGI
jgi:hypothetical protein